MLHVVLVHPEIPQNTGSIIRLCAATGAALHLVAPMGFSLDDGKLKRAGLDYWKTVVVGIHPNLDSLALIIPRDRWYMFSVHGTRRFDQVCYQDGDALLFGPESKGLDESIGEVAPEHRVSVPVLPAVRSLNLSATVHIGVYEALRQRKFDFFS